MSNKFHPIYADRYEIKPVDKAAFSLIAIASSALHLWALSSLPTVPLPPALPYLPPLKMCMCGVSGITITMMQLQESRSPEVGIKHRTSPVPPVYDLSQTPPDAFAHYPTHKEAKLMLGPLDATKAKLVNLTCTRTLRHRLIQCEADTDSPQGRATERLFEAHAVLKPLPSYPDFVQVSDKIRVSYAWDELAPVP